MLQHVLIKMYCAIISIILLVMHLCAGVLIIIIQNGTMRLEKHPFFFIMEANSVPIYSVVLFKPAHSKYIIYNSNNTTIVYNKKKLINIIIVQ